MKIKTTIFKSFLVIFLIFGFTDLLYCQNDSKKDFDAIGFELEGKELLFVLNNASKDSEVIKLFGEPEEKSESVLWGADDLEHQTWYYRLQGLEIDFVKDDTKIQIVSSVKFSNPSGLKTSREIGIGSTKEEVLNAYKDEINKNDSKMDSGFIVAGSLFGGLIFELKDDLVTSIFIGASAE
jgi:hypothetical protein